MGRVSVALQILYDHGMIIFHWTEWYEGERLYENLAPENVTDLDLVTTLKLLSALARSDRFNEGTWVELFESGRGLLLFEHWLALERAGGRRPVTYKPTDP